MADYSNDNDSERCVEAFVHRVFFKSWKDWLYEPLNRWEYYLQNEDDPNSVRKTLLRRCDHFDNMAYILEKDFGRKGYTFIYDMDDLRDKLLVWAYTVDKEFFIHYGTRLVIPDPKHRNTQKDYDEYYTTFDELNLGIFYSREFDDEALFSSDRARLYFFDHLIRFLYRLIDITRSPHIKQYDDEEARAKEEEIQKLLEDGTYVLDFKGRLKKSDKSSEDPYLDQMNYE